MFKEFTGRYQIHESSRSFADVVAALEAATGSVENETFDRDLTESRDPSDFEKRMHTHESTSGFMRFHTADHGAWLAALGSRGKARMYTIGNPFNYPQFLIPRERRTQCPRGVTVHAT